jgi:hypothetical protein
VTSGPFGNIEVSVRVNYNLPPPEILNQPNFIQLCKFYNLPIENHEEMKQRLDTILFPERWHLNASEEIPKEYNTEVAQLFEIDRQRYGVEFSKSPFRALHSWAYTNNDYTAKLQTALSHFANTGEILPFKESDELEELFDPLVERDVLTQNLTMLPSCKTRTLRIVDYIENPPYPEKLKPGALATNYPRFMSATTSSNEIWQHFIGSEREDVALIYEINGFSGKPLRDFNPADNQENEVLFHPDCVFCLVAEAEAITISGTSSSKRVAALYAEVQGLRAVEFQNLYTGEFLQRPHVGNTRIGPSGDTGGHSSGNQGLSLDRARSPSG